MRLISFSMTTKAFLDGTKTVTRRLGWECLKPGARLVAVEKAMGLKPGEQVKRLGVIEVTSVRREPLNAITQEDVKAEGFGFDVPSFVSGFCKAMKCEPSTVVTRIEFRKVEERQPSARAMQALSASGLQVAPDLERAMAQSIAKGLPKDRKDWPEAAKEDFEERAAILQYDKNGLSKADSEDAAERLTREKWERLS